MRILGFSKKWDKLYKRESVLLDSLLFTTFRYPRRDKDWEVEEVVQVVYKPRAKDREPLGIARIIRKQEKDISKRLSWFSNPNYPKMPDTITSEEAKEDGFIGQHGGGDMEAIVNFIKDSKRTKPDIVNKLILYWIERYNGKA